MKIIPKIKPTLLNVGSHIFFSGRGTLFPRLRGSWQDSQGRRSAFGKEIGNSETPPPPVSFYPFPFQTFKPRYYSLPVYVSRTGHRERYFPRVYLGNRSILIIRQWKKFANRGEGGGDFFLPLRTFFFISLFEIFSYFFEITFFVSYENKG